MTAKSIGREVAVCAFGFFLMFVAHFLGVMGYGLAQDRSWHMPYWWSYLILYPAAAALVLRMSSAHWLATSVCLVAFPVLYFGALGVMEGDWFSNDGALWGALVALAVTALVARYVAGRRTHRTAPAHLAT
jgi:uncharacterized membrane protein YkvI